MKYLLASLALIWTVLVIINLDSCPNNYMTICSINGCKYGLGQPNNILLKLTAIIAWVGVILFWKKK
jgi:hypothetical protein